MCFGFLNLGSTELLIVLAIVLVVFGPKKLPQIGRAFGEMLTGFRKSTKPDQTDDKKADRVSEENNGHEPK